MARANYGAIETDPRRSGENTASQNDFKQVSILKKKINSSLQIRQLIHSYLICS